MLRISRIKKDSQRENLIRMDGYLFLIYIEDTLLDSE